jgi:hypothetical protein
MVLSSSSSSFGAVNLWLRVTHNPDCLQAVVLPMATKTTNKTAKTYLVPNFIDVLEEETKMGTPSTNTNRQKETKRAECIHQITDSHTNSPF